MDVVLWCVMWMRGCGGDFGGAFTAEESVGGFLLESDIWITKTFASFVGVCLCVSYACVRAWSESWRNIRILFFLSESLLNVVICKIWVDIVSLDEGLIAFF